MLTPTELNDEFGPLATDCLKAQCQHFFGEMLDSLIAPIIVVWPQLVGPGKAVEGCGSRMQTDDKHNIKSLHQRQ